MKKKFYVAMPIVLICAIMTLIAILGFVWEVVDVGAFVPFAFITSVIMPCVLEVILIVLFCQYIRIDNNGIRKYFFQKKIKEFKWKDIKEIRIDQGAIYISLEELVGDKKRWNKKGYIYIMYSDKAIKALKEYMLEGIKVNFNK